MMTTRVAVVLLVLSLCTAAVAQVPGELGYEDIPEMPTGIEGERVQMLFDAVNMSDLDLAQQFYEGHFSEELKQEITLEDFLGFFGSFIRNTEAIDFHSVRTYEPTLEDATVVIFRDMTYDSWKAFSLRYAEGEKPDGLLVGINISPARTPSDVEPEGPLTEAEATTEILTFLNRLCERDLFSGAVMVARRGEVLLAASCGEASKRFHVPINMDTKFNLGSMNKMFTSVACMQLVERGVVTLDEPISKWVDESWLPAELSEKITLHHLLSHTSGLGSYWTDEFGLGSKKRWREIDDYKDIMYADTLSFEPGTDWDYSNSGMFIAGVVIQNATGEDYFDYIRDNVYAPAEMENTDCYDMDCPVENLAIGYWPSDDCASGWKNNYYEHVIRGGPAGGGFSTAPDLFKFARALQDGKLVSEESLEQLWSVQFDREQGPNGYGYGFSIREGAAGKVVGHGGGFTGINANLDMFLDRGYISAVMTNYDGAGSVVDMKISEVLGRVE